ncbi:MAG: MFS transporter [Eubacteriales bacterium]|nr:MFS transporter [Eubacteriales bacterium]
MNTKSKNYLLFLSVLSVFAFGNCMGAIDGALSKIAVALEVDHTVALYVGSIPALTSVASSLFLGFVAGKKLPFKACAVCCAVLMIFAGTIPFLAQNFAAILLARGFFGLGLGGMMSLQNPIATKLIPLESRAAILGVGTCIAFLFQCILQLVGGILADVRWNLVFFTHLILLIPLVAMAFLLPKMALDPPEAKQEGTEKLSATVLVMCVILGVIVMNLAPLLFGSAFYVAALSDSATIASVIAMLFSIGCMIGGLLYPTLYRVLKEKCFAAFLLIGAMGLLISATATSIPLLGIGFFIGGISFASTQTGMMMLIGLLCPPERVAFASALMMVFLNLGAFLCSSWERMIGTITGDSLYAPLLVGAVIFVILAVILFVRSPFPRGRRSA